MKTPSPIERTLRLEIVPFDADPESIEVAIELAANLPVRRARPLLRSTFVDLEIIARNLRVRRARMQERFDFHERGSRSQFPRVEAASYVLCSKLEQRTASGVAAWRTSS